MKKILLITGILVCCIATVSHLTARPGLPFNINHAAFAWTGTTFDFGKIKQNKPVTHKFTFTNTGNTPLVITSVQASCGCTVTDYSKDPIEAGTEGYVKATYNAAVLGQFTKTVTVNANTEEGTVLLTIKGEVVE
jgi:hypothetical protein